MEKETSIGAVIFKRDRGNVKFLILKRKGNSVWEFPKGHIESNENELETLKRELYEEVGVKKYKLIEDFKDSVSYINSKKKLRELIFYLVEYNGPIKRSEEHSESKWVALDEAQNYFEYEDILNLLKRVDRIINA